jgi:hypothetical protein
MVAKQAGPARSGSPGRLGIGEALGLGEPAADVEDDEGEQGADEEGDSPAPGLERLLRHAQLEDEQDHRGDELARDQGHILEARIEAAPLAAGNLAQIGSGGAIFAAEAEALQHARQHEEGRSEPADRGRGGKQGDQQRPGAHQADREGQPRLAPLAVGIDSHHPGADRAHDEADREDRGGVQQLRSAIALGEKDRREVEREGGVDVPIVPFDHVAGRAADDVADAVTGGRLPCCPIAHAGSDPIDPGDATLTRSRPIVEMPDSKDGRRAVDPGPQRSATWRETSGGLPGPESRQWTVSVTASSVSMPITRSISRQRVK